MNRFKVTYSRESEELTLPYGSSDTYYVKNDKVCFSVNVYIETVIDIVECKSDDVILEKYGDLSIISIDHIGNKDYQFEAIAPKDYIRVESSNVLTKVKNGSRDKMCSDEVQERFLRNGKRIQTPTYVIDDC
jgi:D-alanine-D-alanine ligase-like ATP-grasp enzyme